MARITVKDPQTGQTKVVRIVDKRPYWMYDSVTWQNGDVEEFYFQNPSKALVETNLKQFSSIQLGFLFEFHTIRLVPREPITIADAKIMFGSTVLSFIREGDIESFTAPAIIFNSACGLSGATTTTATDMVSLGHPSYDARVRLPMPIQIKGGETFYFKVTFGAALAGLASSRKVYLVLDGLLLRPARGG